MKRLNRQAVEMTPLLDVVFILLFALILNVNVSKAKDEAEIEALEAENEVLIASEVSLEKQLEEANMSESDYLSQLLQARDALADLEDHSKNQEAVLAQIQEQVKAIEASEGIEIDEWLKYEQIVDRYLFVEVLIESGDGRIYVNEDYTGVNVLAKAIVNKDIKDEKQADLAGYLYDWLDHKDGGYSFVFITVVADSQVKRASTELVFDTLSIMQPEFDTEQFMVNRYISYK